MGLLDFMQTPAGMGLLAGAAGYASGAKRGTPVNNIGRGLLGGLVGYNQATEQQTQLAQQAKANELRDMQLQQMRDGITKEAAIRDAAKSSYTPPAPGLGLLNASLPPELQTPTVAAKPGGFDTQGFLTQLKSIDPLKAIEWEQKLVKEPKFQVVGGALVRTDTPVPKEVYRAPEKPEAPPSSVREFIYAQQDPAFGTWLREQANLKAPKVVNNLPPNETEYLKARGKDDAEIMSLINKQAFSAPSQIRSLERMEQLLKDVDGGMLAPTGLQVASAANAFGIKLDPKLGNKEAAEALAREMAGKLRQPGTGPMTDKDFDNFLTQIPSLSKTAEGRKQITATLRAGLARDIEIGKRARAYEKKHGRIDNGFLDETAQFIAENPVVQMPKGWVVNR